MYNVFINGDYMATKSIIGKVKGINLAGFNLVDLAILVAGKVFSEQVLGQFPLFNRAWLTKLITVLLIGYFGMKNKYLKTFTMGIAVDLAEDFLSPLLTRLVQPVASATQNIFASIPL